MSDGFTAKVESASLLAAFDRLPDTILKYTKPASKVSADSLQREMRRRVKRRSGSTAEGIEVTELKDGSGYLVQATNKRLRTNVSPAVASAVAEGRMPAMQMSAKNVPLYLEAGTRNMAARPFFYDSIRLEYPAHERRIDDAVARGAAEEGLGS
jgi:hypothetical protein